MCSQILGTKENFDNNMENKTKTREGDTARVQAGVKWLGAKAREIKFGTIRGLLVCDGAITKGHRYRAQRTGKPRCRDQAEKLADDRILAKALRDIAAETLALKGDWKLKVKVAHGTILTWELEEPEHSTPNETK